MDKKEMKTVYTVVERGNKSYWVKIGIGFVNKDGSWNLKLDATPTNGSIQVRDYEERQENGNGNGRASREAAAEAPF
jgi:hypothetical protein